MLKYICLISVVSDLSHYLARFSKEASSGASSRSVPFLNTKNLALNAYLFTVGTHALNQYILSQTMNISSKAPLRTSVIG